MHFKIIVDTFWKRLGVIQFAERAAKNARENTRFSPLLESVSPVMSDAINESNLHKTDEVFAILTDLKIAGKNEKLFVIINDWLEDTAWDRLFAEQRAQQAAQKAELKELKSLQLVEAWDKAEAEQRFADKYAEYEQRHAAERARLHAAHPNEAESPERGYYNSYK
jgi:hypothetical protein